MIWDWILVFMIMFFIGMAVWAGVSEMTVPELLRELWDWMMGTKEDFVDEGADTFMYN